MNRLFPVLCMSIGGWLGWEIGALFSTFTAYLVAVVGTALGLYLANEVRRNYLP